jgi:hypothetical protein
MNDDLLQSNFISDEVAVVGKDDDESKSFLVLGLIIIIVIIINIYFIFKYYTV